VLIAPVIPGLNDSQMATVLERAHAAGATSASWVLLRLPASVAPVFEQRLRATLPGAAQKVLGRIRETRGGELYDPRFHSRQRGEGAYARTIAAIFDATMARLGMTQRDDPDDAPTTFRRPDRPGKQLRLL